MHVVGHDNSEVASPPTTVKTMRYALRLDQNDPNPFSAATNIRYTVGQSGSVQLKVYDVAGRLVRTLINRSVATGTYVETWDGRNNSGTEMASGIYFFRLQVDGKTLTRKAVIVR